MCRVLGAGVGFVGVVGLVRREQRVGEPVEGVDNRVGAVFGRGLGPHERERGEQDRARFDEVTHGARAELGALPAQDVGAEVVIAEVE